MPVSLDGYLHAVLNSGLLTEDRLNETLRAMPMGTAPDPLSLAARLEASNLLTRWQNELLLAGKYKGFFLGKYRLLSLLGAGGMGQVFHAEHTLMRRPVAIKVLPKKFLADADAVERFHREAQAIAAVDHPNIVHAFSVDNEGDLHYLVMEYVAGEDLARRVQTKGPLPCAEAADFIRQAADGLDHAHARGLIHRDIKPANLLVDSEGFVKILDLGLARLSGSEQTPSAMEDETVRGTLDYMAPEQAMDARNADPRADQYSLGCTFYFLLSGHAPFTGGSMAELILAHQTREPMDLRDIRPDLPDDLWEILKRMMAKRPADRFESAGSISQALVDWRVLHVANDATATIAQGDTISTRFHAAVAGTPTRQASRETYEEESEGEASAPARRMLFPILAASLGVVALLGVVAWMALPSADERVVEERSRRKFGEVDNIAWNTKPPSKPTAVAQAAKTPDKPKPVEKPKPTEKPKPKEEKPQTSQPAKPVPKPPSLPLEPIGSFPERTFAEEPTGTIVIEAEHFLANFGRSDSKWEVIDLPGGSGEKGMFAGPNNQLNFDDKFEAIAPRLDFRVQLSKKGRYYVWLRGQAKEGQDDSCHLGINGKTNSNCKHVSGFNSQLGWTRVTHDKRTPYFDVKSPGWHTLNLWMREDGLIVDKIVITNDSKFTAKGDGPAESSTVEEKKK